MSPIPGNSSSQGKKPTAPTIGAATAGNGSASVDFTPSAHIGKGTISYTAISTPGSITGTSSSNPISVTGLTNGTQYIFTVSGITNYGVSSDSSAFSSFATPMAPPFFPFFPTFAPPFFPFFPTFAPPFFPFFPTFTPPFFPFFPTFSAPTPAPPFFPPAFPYFFSSLRFKHSIVNVINTKKI